MDVLREYRGFDIKFGGLLKGSLGESKFKREKIIQHYSTCIGGWWNLQFFATNQGKLDVWENIGNLILNWEAY